MEQLEIIRPDDWHLHLRDHDMLKTVLPYTAQNFGRAIIMPNLNPPVITTADALAYRGRILDALPENSTFDPLMTVYLTDQTNVDDIVHGYESGAFVAAKMYPANATTNSAHGVTDVRNVEDVITAMAEIGMPLLIHGEVTHKDVDIFDREAVFIEQILKPLKERHPTLKVVLEHITTKEAAKFVAEESDDTVGATITPQHIIINRNAMFQGGIRPHYFCLPIAKREEHRLAVRAAAVSGNKKFFLGTDSAPHSTDAKENACGCAGIFNAPGAIEIYLEVFEEEGKIENFEAFASLNGPSFYGLPTNKDKITLKKQSWSMPNKIIVDGKTDITPFKASEDIHWQIQK